jgi:hypothetical protein
VYTRASVASFPWPGKKRKLTGLASRKASATIDAEENQVRSPSAAAATRTKRKSHLRLRSAGPRETAAHCNELTAYRSEGRTSAKNKRERERESRKHMQMRSCQLRAAYIRNRALVCICAWHVGCCAGSPLSRGEYKGAYNIEVFGGASLRGAGSIGRRYWNLFHDEEMKPGNTFKERARRPFRLIRQPNFESGSGKCWSQTSLISSKRARRLSKK